MINSKILSSVLNPHWQILENSSRNFSENSVFWGVRKTVLLENSPNFFQNFRFRGMSSTDFWKTHPTKFFEYVVSFCKISGHELDCFLKTRPYFDDFARNRSDFSRNPPGICFIFRLKCSFAGLKKIYSQNLVNPFLRQESPVVLQPFRQKLSRFS